MAESVILIRDGEKPSLLRLSQDSILELARQVLADKSIVGVLFCERMSEDGPPPAPPDKGGE